MPLHNLAFWFCAFFLLGVLAVSVYNNLLIVFLLGLLVLSALLIFKKYSFAFLSLAILLGAGYYQVFDRLQKAQPILFDQPTEFTGVIRKIEQTETKQQIAVGKIQINARPYPDFSYGDEIRVKGIIKIPPPESANFYAKNGVLGIVNLPRIELIRTGQGNRIFAALFNLKGRVKEVFKSVLPQQKAAFLTGLTLGEREDFSKEFRQKMSLSGTTHLVALSGYNISVIAITVTLIFSAFLSGAAPFYLSVLTIILFVLMTGAEASVVRAAIMGIIALLAQQSQRAYSLRNAIILAAFFMVLANPKVLVFDLGFQLSFMALLGIVVLRPFLKKILRIENAGFLGWKENLLTTLSAQLAVVPFILGNFGIFSLTALISNVLIAEAIPVTMGLGFIMAGLGFVSLFLAKIIGLAANIFLSYELWIINLFSKLTIPIAAKSFGFFAAIIYYLLLVGLIYKFNKSK